MCHLRAAGNKNNPPFTYFSDYCWDASCKHPGTTVEFLVMALKLINCTLEVIKEDVQAEATCDMIANGSADISLLALRQTLSRMERVDFTQPINFLYFGYVVKEIPQLQVEDYILSSFTIGTLVFMVETAVLIGALIYAYTKVFHYNEGTIWHWMILCCQAYLNQFSCKLRGPIAAHMMVGFFLYFSMLIMYAYQAKLKSFLTLSHARGIDFINMDGMIQAGYTMVLEKLGYNPLDYCQPEQCAKLRQIPNQKIVRLQMGEDLFETVINHKKYVGFAAYTYDMDRHPISYLLPKQNLLFVKDAEKSPDYLGFAINKLEKYIIPSEFRNNPWLRENLNNAILTITGSYPSIRARYMEDFYAYNSFSSISQKAKIRLSHLITLFERCGEILGIALLALIIELLYRHFGHQVTLYIWEHWICSRFSYKLKISRVLSREEFPRRNVVVLPMRRSVSPTKKSFEKFTITPISSIS